jgi:hypothetical protein
MSRSLVKGMSRPTFTGGLSACFIVFGLFLCLAIGVNSSKASLQIARERRSEQLSITAPVQLTGSSQSRGYLTTPQELVIIKRKADQGLEPYQQAVDEVLAWADQDWNFTLDAHENCAGSDNPAWNDDNEGTPIVYAKALAYHLTGDGQYAEAVRSILQRIMTEVHTISLEERQCRLNFAWGTPELVAAADLIEDYWRTQTCSGPISTLYSDTTIGSGNCKILFQNWLVKNPYYVVSYAAEETQSNWGAAATNALAYIADYLWDRPSVRLIRRNPPQVNGGAEIAATAAEAYIHANQLALDRMNGYKIGYLSTSCDDLSGPQQSDLYPPVKSQITEHGIIPEDARRDESCNIPHYNGEYQNYPEIHLGNNIQQCELMLRRGDRSCFDNVDNTDIPAYTYLDRNGEVKTTHLYPGRGSIERAIKAIIVDAGTEWKRTSALEVAYRYYSTNSTLPGIEQWFARLDRPGRCRQDICFGTLTHGFAPGENPGPPPTAPPPSDNWRFIFLPIIALYLGDDLELERTAQVFKGWLGDRDIYAGFEYGKLSWQAAPKNPVGINPVGAEKDGHSIDGALPEEMRRGGKFRWPPQKTNYTWEALQGALVQAELLQQAGYPAWEWEDKALLQAVQFLYDIGWKPEGDDEWPPWLVN